MAEGAIATEPEALESGVGIKDGPRHERDMMAGRVAQVNMPMDEWVPRVQQHASTEGAF